MPVVKVSTVPGANKALKEEVREQKAAGNVVDANALKKQLKKMKKITEEEKKVFKKEKEADKDDWRVAIRAKPVLKRIDVEAVEAERLERQKERESGETARHLAAIHLQPKLKKVEIDEEAETRRKKYEKEERQLYIKDTERKAERKCAHSYGMIWDPRLKKCISSESSLSEEDVEKAIGMSIAILGDDDIKDDGCIIS